MVISFDDYTIGYSLQQKLETGGLGLKIYRWDVRDVSPPPSPGRIPVPSDGLTEHFRHLSGTTRQITHRTGSTVSVGSIAPLYINRLQQSPEHTPLYVLCYFESKVHREGVHITKQ